MQNYDGMVLSCVKVQSYIEMWVTWWRSWSSHCRNWKGIGSIPDVVIWICHWHNPSGRTVALGSIQPLTEMSTRNISWGVKVAGALGWWPYHLHVPIVLQSGASTSWNSQGLYRDCFTFTLYGIINYWNNYFIFTVFQWSWNSDCMYSHGLRMLSMICCVTLLFLIPIIDSLLSLCCTSVKPTQPKHEYACIAWHLYHWQFVSNLKECKEDCISQQYLSGGSIFIQYLLWMPEQNCSSISDSLTRITKNCANFPCFEVLVVLSVLSSGMWPCVDSCMGGFTWVYYFHLQCSLVMDAFRIYGQLWSSAFYFIFDYVLCILLCCR